MFEPKSYALDLVEQLADPKRTRIRGKQPPVVPVEARAVAALSAKGSKPRLTPPIRIAAAAAEQGGWSALEKQAMAGLRARALRREQTRLLHNRTAERRGVHVLSSWAGGHKPTERVNCVKCGESCVVHQVSSWKDFKCGVKKVILPWSRPGSAGRLTTDHVLDRRLAIVDDKVQERERMQERLEEGQQVCEPAHPTTHEEADLRCLHCDYKVIWRRHSEFFWRGRKGKYVRACSGQRAEPSSPPS